MRTLVSIAQKIILNSPGGFARLLGSKFFEDLVPEFLWIEATNQCNSRCVSCGIWQKAPARDLLTPDEIETALKDPVFRRLKIVVVSGGEPTLRRDLEAILAGVHRAAPQAAIVLSSNAMLPERLLCAVSSALAQNMTLEVGVSLDGIATFHDQSRGVPGLFPKVDYVLRELMKLKCTYGAKLRVTVGFTLSDTTVAQTEAVRRYAEGLGATFNVQWYNQAPYYGNLERDLLSKRDELEQAARQLRPTVLHALAMRALRGEAVTFPCSSMFNFCLLKCDGDIVPCFRMWNCNVGNVKLIAPSAIWRSNGAREARSLTRSCSGCLNTCGVLWSYDANYIGRSRFYLRHPGSLLEKLGALGRSRFHSTSLTVRQL